MSYPCFKPVAKAATILGMLQGIAWFVLSLLAILAYSGSFQGTGKSQSQGDLLTQKLYEMFANPPRFTSTITEDDLFVWSIFYMILSLLWIIVSWYFYSVIRGVFNGKLKSSAWCWSILTIIISITDLSLVIAAGVRMGAYNKYMKYPLEWAASGIVMTVAARGFVLWIINVFLAIFLLKRMDKAVDMDEQQTQRQAWNGNKSSSWNRQDQSIPVGNEFNWQQIIDATEIRRDHQRRNGIQNDGFDWEPRPEPMQNLERKASRISNQQQFNRHSKQHKPPTPTPDYPINLQRPMRQLSNRY